MLVCGWEYEKVDRSAVKKNDGGDEKGYELEWENENGIGMKEREGEDSEEE